MKIISQPVAYILSFAFFMLYAFKNALFVHYVLGMVARAHLHAKGWKLINLSISMLKI